MNRQKGFTLIELMIGIGLGVVLLTGAVGMFTTTLFANVNATKEQRFEQAIQIMTSIMTSEIRRSGYTNAGQIASPSTPVPLTPQANGAYYAGSGSCALLSHSTPTQDELFQGYKLLNNVIYQHSGTTNGSCGAGLTGWSAVSDLSYMKVTTLTFSGAPVVTLNLEAEAVGLTTKDSTGVTVPVKRIVAMTVTVRNP